MRPTAKGPYSAVMSTSARHVVAALFAVGSTLAHAEAPKPMVLYPELQAYVKTVLPAIDSLGDDRKKELKKLAQFVKAKRAAKAPANVLFICTHNSRRSHLGQLWAAVAAAYYGVGGVQTFSGGTEATAFNPRAVAALQRAGFKLEAGEGTNPHYAVTFSSSVPAMDAFSKKFGDAPNPTTNFAAVMTCSHADQSCPIVPGASLRVPLHYDDPKEADGKPEETATYDARSRQIATEMFYLFSQVGA